MEKYKATRNNQSGNEGLEEERPKTQDEKNIENNMNTIQNAADVAIATKNPYAMAAGYAVKGLDKMTGGKSTEFLGKTMNDANKIAPGGKQIQNMSNKLSESGMGDKIGQAASMSSGGGKGAAGKAATGKAAGNTASKTAGKAASGASSKSTSTSSSKSSGSVFSSDSGVLTNNIMGSMGSGNKFKLIAIGAGAFFVLVLIMAITGSKDQQNLALTNLTVFSESSIGAVQCSAEQIDEKVLYVGDKRIESLETSLVDSKANFITNTSGYTNFKDNIFSSLETKFANKENEIVILSFDIYDLANFDMYVADYRNLIDRYTDIKFFVLSISPIDEYNNSLGITNSTIKDYNSKIQDNFGDNYIDTFNYLNYNFATIDGISYDDETNKEMHDYILDSISDSGMVLCSGGAIENITDSQLLGGGATVLSNGETVLSKIDQVELDEWNIILSNDVSRAGKGTGLAPAIAAYDLIQGSMVNGFVIPYYWGGGHTPNSGIDGSWGELKTVTLSGSNYQSVGSVYSYGLDSLGFIAWALKNGGCSSFTYKTANELIALGDEIDSLETTPGDIVVEGNKAMLILRNDGFNTIVAEANEEYGVVFNSYYTEALNSFNIIRMSSYYSNNCG